MQTLLFDSETDGLLPELTMIHSIVTKDVDTNEVTSCADQEGYTPISVGLDMLAQADVIVAHNALKFDVAALQKVYPDWKPQGTVRDTLLLARLIWPDVKDLDFMLRVKHPEFPARLIGRHSLEAWGYRLGYLKGDYGKSTDWKVWTPDMQDYCEQDVSVLEVLWRKCVTKGYAERAIEIEHKFQTIIDLQEKHGWPFDTKAAGSLYSDIAKKKQIIEQELQEKVFPPRWVAKGVVVGKGKMFTKSGAISKTKYTAGAPYTKIEWRTFNPGSRDQIAERLTTLRGWKPNTFTKSGKAEINETVLDQMPWPEAAKLGEYLTLDKRVGAISEGKQAWLKLVRDGRIFGLVMTLGAVTRRCTHNKPNVSQVPATKSMYGKEYRALYIALPGYKLVGADASGLELRCLGHYMFKYDGGKFAKAVIEGTEEKSTDVHSLNARALGFEPQKHYTVNGKSTTGRDIAKTFIYAFLYGAGLKKLASILGVSLAESKKIMARYMKTFPALKRLKMQIAVTLEKRGYLAAIDGGRLHVRSEHSALNTLLQSAGAIAVKLATNLFYKDVSTHGYVLGDEYALVGHIHDELQVMTKENLTDEIGNALVSAMQRAGVELGFKCDLDGSFKVGNNWAETH